MDELAASHLNLLKGSLHTALVYNRQLPDGQGADQRRIRHKDIGCSIFKLETGINGCL